MRVGIVGGGAMGNWLKKEISKLHEAKVYDVDPAKSDAESLEELTKWAEVVIVAVPFWLAADVLRQIGNYARGRLVMDIATFKEGLEEAYASFPPDAEAASVHPMFGPGAPSLRGQKVLVMEVPGRRGAEKAFRFWQELGAEVQWADFKNHDRYVGVTIALNYAVGLALARLYEELGEEVFKYGGTSFKYLSTYAFSLLKDPNAWRYAEKAPLDQFIKALVDKRTPKPLASPDEAYEKFYKALSCL
ncbi:MAG: prephenate dehydrogenase [Pyrobaculum sp.]